jgi:hypothetical protein
MVMIRLLVTEARSAIDVVISRSHQQSHSQRIPKSSLSGRLSERKKPAEESGCAGCSVG